MATDKDKPLPKSTAQKLIESFTPAQLEILGEFLANERGIACLRLAVELYELTRGKSGVYTGKAVVSEDGKHVTIIEEKKFNDR